jgi:small basic protein (TIGR04137 family)
VTAAGIEGPAGVPGRGVDGLWKQESSAMSLDRSLKTKGKLTVKRSVLTRAERVEKLIAEKKIDPKTGSVLGLAKTLIPKT